MHTTVYKVRTLKVDILRVRLDDVGSDVAGNLKHTLIVLDSVLEINGRILKFIFVGVVALLEFNDALHFRVIKIEIVLRMVCIIVSHYFLKNLEHLKKLEKLEPYAVLLHITCYHSYNSSANEDSFIFLP